MNKVSLLIVLSVLVAPTVFATKTANKTVAANENTVHVITRPEIMGLWGMQLPNNNTCIEYYNFKAGNEMVVNSGKEWSTGIYDYQPAPDNTMTKLPVMAMQIKYDNDEMDCSGVQQDQSGEISQFFVKWNSPNSISFCGTATGEQCVVDLHRVLP
ncbi:hypothetical protein [Acinetobacter rudis]|uniref:Uncharacterized protein n=1 Tax=Acinetobacter rudis TaxID=632955 RepID=A0AAW8J911_9GAMM|nr:hypothetical protein [Acinetobacter rudis]MDQ8935993.1 hypothetical protein [Acinetobacter rudis]MDQ8953839.1 hypothetical protein [Acinetobacter rudis]MDQ9018256.1 hypothetical protein [Acinetobacter rudis]